MPKALTLQSSFNSGVLDPRLAARVDVKAFYQGMETGTNVLCLPQGGVKRRPGMAYVAGVSGAARLASFAFNTEQTYLLVFTDQNVAIYKDGVKQADVTTPWVESDLFELRWTQSADTMIVVHEDYQPRKLVRGASHSSWTLSTITLSNIPSVNFDDALSSVQNEIQDIEFPSGWSGSETYAIVLNGESTGTLTYSAGTSTNATTLQSALRGLPGTSASGVTVSYVSGTTYRVTFGGDDGEIDWPLMTATVLSGGDSITVTVNQEGGSTDEDVWSSTRGWPKCVTFYQGRLWFGGSTYKPQSLWGSKTNDFFNFDLGTGLDDEGIFVTLDTDQVNAIRDIFPGRHLQVFTTGGEFYIPQVPITPGNIAVRRQTLFGSSNVPPISIDGATLFIDRTGKSVREFLYTYVEEAYNANSVSLLAPHLISAPVDMAAVTGTESEDANYVFLVNNDGTMAVYNTLRAQEISAWTKWETDGQIESVCSVVDDVYFVVKRNINGVDTRFVEQMDTTGYTDANVRQTLSPASATVTGLSHLNGEECRVRADGVVMANATPASGSITLSRTAEDVEVGLDFTVTVKTMPLSAEFKDGPTLTRTKRIREVTLHLYESVAVRVEGQVIPVRNFGNNVLDQGLVTFTGLKEVSLLGWSDLAQVTITQEDPAPMTILAIALEVRV